jgi:hypothetical protein
MAWRDDNRGNIRDMCEAHGHDTVVKVMTEAIQKNEFLPEQASLKELWDAFTDHAPVDGSDRKLMESVGTGSFIKITGELINARVIDAYNQTPSIGDSLVTVVPSRFKKEDVTGITDTDLPDEVVEHAPYKDSGVEEKYVTIYNKKYGRVISLTEEMVYMDQTGQVLNRAQTIGEGCRYKREDLILTAIQDLDTEAYYPSGTATAVYAGNQVVSSSPFGPSGLNAVLKQAQLAVSDAAEGGKFIDVDLIGKPLLVPVDLWSDAWELASSPTHPQTAERAPNFFQGKFVPYTSAHITRRSTTTWYWGDFKKAYWWTEVWPLQVFTAKPGHEDEFNKDIISKYKARFYGGCHCIDNRKIFKATA